MRRVVVIGLDAFDPGLVDKWLGELPHLRSLLADGIHGPLESVVQPVTPVAWTSLTTGRDAGHFGFTDFRHRPSGDYGPLRLVHARLVEVPTLYDLASAADMAVAWVGVPLGYPPPAADGSVSVACFMAPSVEHQLTHPPELQARLLAATSTPFLLDVVAPSTMDAAARTDLALRLRELDGQRFDLALHLMRTEPWRLLFLVCMGTDRVGHYFMRYCDPLHHRFDPDPRFADAILEHYRYCDRRIGELLAELDGDTTVVVVSDHGIQHLDGRFALNAWLAQNGYLALRRPLEAPTPFDPDLVDWERTRAWAFGYGGQIFFNVAGRDRLGVVDPDDVPDLQDELAAGLREVVGYGSEHLPVRTFSGRDLYSGPLADRCPDLCIQIDGLRTLVTDHLGGAPKVVPVTELGPDDASHAPYGFFAASGAGIDADGRLDGLHLLDVAPSVLDLLGIAGSGLDGRVIHRARDEERMAVDDVFSDADEAELASRLRTLYLE